MSAHERGRRLHPASLLFRLWAHVRALVIPILALLLATSGSGRQAWIALLLIPSVVIEVVRYCTLRYRFGEHDLIITEGLLWRRQRHIPLQRIQNIDLVQGPVHRLLGVAEVRIQTASGSEPEADLKVVSLADVRTIRDRVFDHRPDGADTPARDPPRGDQLLTLGWGDLLWLSLVANQGLAIVAAGLGLAWELNLFDRVRLPDVSGLVTSGAPLWQIALAAAGLVLGVALTLFVLSAVWTVIRLYGFCLRQVGEEFRIECGLLTRRTATIPRHRIQLVSLKETPQHRLMGCVSVTVETAGGGPDDGSDLSRSLFAPLVRRRDLQALLRRIDPGIGADPLPWQRLEPDAVRRGTRRGAILGVLLGVALATVLWFHVRWWGGAAGLTAALIILAHQRAAVRAVRLAVDGDRLGLRVGVLTRRTALTRAPCAQVVRLTETPFDRRWRMASVEVDTAGGGWGGTGLTFRYVRAGRAQEIARSVADRAARTDLAW